MITMKHIIKFIITAILLYVIIAFITWDIKWITVHWVIRTVYLILSIMFTIPFCIDDKQNIKHS